MSEQHDHEEAHREFRRSREDLLTTIEQSETPVIKDAAKALSRLILVNQISQKMTWADAKNDADLMRAFERHLGPMRRPQLDFLWELDTLRTLEREGAITKAIVLYAQYKTLIISEVDEASTFEQEIHTRASANDVWELFHPTYDRLVATINGLLAEFLDIEEHRHRAPTQRTLNSVPMLNLTGLSRPGSLNDILSLMNHELSTRYKTNRAAVIPQRGIYLPERLLGDHPNSIPLLYWRNHPLEDKSVDQLSSSSSSSCSSTASQEASAKPGRRRSRSALQNLLKWGEKTDKE